MSLDGVRSLPGVFHLRRRRYRNRFLHGQFGTFWGQFGSFEEALASVPAGRASSYEDETLLDFHADQFMQVLPFDWPVLYYLSRGIADGSVRSVIDFGGHIGVKYRAYRPLLDLPDGFRWCVVDLPPMIREGRRRAAAEDLPHLSFFDDVAQVAEADLLLCSGVLQFCPFPLADIIARCAGRPSRIILNKVPFSRDGAFVTLENFDRVKVAYRIFDRNEHDAAMSRLGYTLRGRWRIPYRDFEIPYARPPRRAKMFGEVWHAAV
ncbi:methyltransferase, TIGR04325 family [Lichenihabitans sp. Uapishka_5]|uniref:methyltransferase, TIGR04325 family n=1 Tax=Lichenihabitans sp. Uapishka_5 TaxID=3037302 RepID=UPI0029E80C8D|nr:methyltransferase, TIGR04325 family [Lichenihabitans sp. Uapishka_5]MDX7950258.1 methyltransferase, TIGR04325 family [Lichenihabitans sp. Uapishka_5]